MARLVFIPHWCHVHLGSKRGRCFCHSVFELTRPPNFDVLNLSKLSGPSISTNTSCKDGVLQDSPAHIVAKTSRATRFESTHHATVPCSLYLSQNEKCPPNPSSAIVRPDDRRTRPRHLQSASISAKHLPYTNDVPPKEGSPSKASPAGSAAATTAAGNRAEFFSPTHHSLIAITICCVSYFQCRTPPTSCTTRVPEKLPSDQDRRCRDQTAKGRRPAKVDARSAGREVWLQPVLRWSLCQRA